MGPDHEYTILSGINRAGVGRWIGSIAALLSSLIVFGFLAVVDLAKTLGVAPQMPSLILWPIGAGAVYLALYWYFDRHFWKVAAVSKFLKLPDLSGRWACAGQGLDADKKPTFRWDGEVTIIR